MNWLSKLIKKITLPSEIEDSNWGRDFGWYIEFEGKRIGELVDCKPEDMFWYTYKLIAYKELESIVLDFSNWNACKFRYLNKHYLQYVENAFCGGSSFEYVKDDTIISMRGLYLT